MKKLLFLLLAFSAAGLMAAGAGKNLISNPELKLDAKGRLTGWVYPRKGAWILNNDNTIGLQEGYQGYSAFWGQRLDAKPFTSYKLEFEVKAENLSKMAGVYYVWSDAAGKRLASERFAYRRGPGSTDGWEKVSAVLNQVDPVKTAKLAVCFSIYNAQTKGTGKIFFRNISLTAVGEDDDDDKPAVKAPAKAAPAKAAPAEKAPAKAAPAKKPAAKKAVKKAAPQIELTFPSHKLTSKNPGEPYYLEKGRVGFFNLYNNKPIGGEIFLKVTAPKGFYAEVYMMPRGSQRTSLIQADADGNFTIPSRTEWRGMGNSFLFELRDGCPEKFTLKLEFMAGGKVLYSQEIPIVTLPKEPLLTQKPKFKLSSWYGYPLARVVPEKTGKGILGDKLLQSWADAGFTGARGVAVGDWDTFMECTGVFSWRVFQDKNIRPQQTAGGADGSLLCPSALIAAGKEYFAERVKKSSAYPQLLKGRPACIDYEPYCYGWVTTACFCKSCRTAFQQFAKLPKRPGKRKILIQYEKEWVKFRCQQRADLIKAMAEGLKLAAPKSQFYFCTMPSPGAGEEEEYAKIYGILPELYEDFVDEFLPMNYVPSILFYQRLEKDALTLTKPITTVLDNGWGGTFSGYYAGRLAMQIVSVAFCNLKGACPATGLLRMDSEYHLATRSAMRTVCVLEKPELQGKLVKNAPFKFEHNDSAKLNFHVFTRQISDQKYLLMLVNNNPAAPLYTKVTAAANFKANKVQLSDPLRNTVYANGSKTVWSLADLKKGFELELKPLEYRFILVSDQLKKGLAPEDLKAYTAKRQAQDAALQKVAAAKRGNDMSFEVKGAKVYMTAANTALTVDLQRGGAAVYKVKNQNIATLGADSMIEPTPLNFGDMNAAIIDSKLDKNSVSVTVSTMLKTAAFNGLEVRRTLILYRDKKAVEVKVAVVPTKGYRPFRYKFLNMVELAKASSTTTYGQLVGYKLPDGQAVKVDESVKHMAFCRPGRTLSAPYRRYVPNPGVFNGKWCEAFEHSNPANSLRVTFPAADELIFWRGSKEATLEIVCLDAYPDRDPHKVRTWYGSYTLEYLGK